MSMQAKTERLRLQARALGLPEERADEILREEQEIADRSDTPADVFGEALMRLSIQAGAGTEPPPDCPSA